MTAWHRLVGFITTSWRQFGSLCALSSFLLVVLIVAGCGATTTHPGISERSAPAPSPSSSGSVVDRVTPTLVLRNPPSTTLDVSLSLTFDQLSGAVEPMTEGGLGFESGGQDISFAGDERVSCNGVEFPLKDRAAVFQALRAPTAQVVGTTLRCDYAVGGTVASVSLQIPSPPTMTSPQQGAQVARSVQTQVTYTFDSATSSDVGLVALAPGSQPPKVTARMNTPGPRQATVDTSGFAPGSDMLVLSASLAPRITLTGASFKSASAFGMATAAVDIRWM
jgi:hypothetical protein